MITVSDLTYTYPGAEAETLHGLNFEVGNQEIFGFLGPSGAGKSTTQKILIGLLKGYQGTVQVMDQEIREWGDAFYETVGVSFEMPNHYLKLSARENLDYFRSLYSGETYNPMEVLEWVDLHADANKKVEDFSKGMKIRLNVARSILHKPKLLFLDEPTNGLDPVNARRIKDLVLKLRSRGTTVFITTHDMMVADELCDRVAFITAGNIDVIDSPTSLKKRYGKRELQVESRTGDAKPVVHNFPLDGLAQNEAFMQLLRSDAQLETVHSQETTLEKIFIEVTGQHLVI